MRLTASLVIAAGTIATVLACSSSDGGTVGEAAPDASTSSSGTGSSSGGDNDAGGSSGTTSSGGSSGAADAGDGGDAADATTVEYVKTTTETMQHEGATRKYILSVPLDYAASKKYPLYIWLHGNPGVAENQRLDTVTKNEAIIAYPGSLIVDGWDHTAALQDNTDTTFLFAMIDALKTKYSIDEGRVLLSGWSGGGFMSGLMACR